MPDFCQNSFIEFLLGHGPPAPAAFAGLNFQVFVIEPKSHSPEHNVKALGQNVVVRADFGNVLRTE